MYADDIALISSSVEGAQRQLDIMGEWCSKWDMKINAKKSEILHIRNPQKKRCTTAVTCGTETLNYTSTYKYLGYHLNEHLSHTKTVETLTSSAQRSFGRVVQLFKGLKNMGIRTFETLYHSYVVPIMNYSSAVWGYKEFHDAQVLKNRVGRFYLGVNKFTPVAATSLELDWLDPKFVRWLEILRYKNRLAKMEPNRLPVKVYKWEESLNIMGWVKDLKHILEYCNMSECSEMTATCDLDVAEARLKRINRDKWWLEAHSKPKLRTYIKVHDLGNTQTIVKKNLSRSHRSLITKLKCGVLPIALETGRYTDKKEELRVCVICNKNLVESETHFLLKCEALKDVRKIYKSQLKDEIDFENWPDCEIFMSLLSSAHLKITCKMVEALFEKRNDLMYIAS